MGRNIQKIFICVATAAVLSSVSAFAQHYIGIRGGWGGGTGRLEPKPDERGTVWGLYHGGVSWKYYSKERYVGGVEADLLFMQQGFRTYDLEDVPAGSTDRAERTYYYQRTVNTITLPIYWQTHAYLFRRQMRVFLNLGVTLSYNYSSKEESYNYITGEKTSGKYHMKLTRDNPFTYGLGGGAGVGWSFDRLEILFEGRYYLGYGDIYRNRNRYELNPIRSPLDNIQFALGVYWRLGKGGIISPPSPKVAAKIREYERYKRERDRLKNPARQLRDWDKEYQKVINEEVSALDEEIRAASAEIAKNAREALSPIGGVYPDLPLEGISPSMPAR